MAYDPAEANKPYKQLLIERSTEAVTKSLLAIFAWFLINRYIFRDNTVPPSWYAIGFLFFCAHHTWQPKLTRFLRDVLRGEEYRNKAD